MKHWIPLFCLFLSGHVFGQSTSKVKEGDKHSQEYLVYEVLKKDRTVKHGKYAEFRWGEKTVKGQYHENRKTGKWIHMRNGLIHTRVSYNGNGTCDVIKYQGPLVTKYEAKAADFQLGHGKYKETFADTLVTSGSYKNGLKNGIWQYFIDGQKFTRVAYSKNLRQGVETIWYNGKTKSIRTFRDDKFHGKNTVFWEGGITIKSMTNYKNGEPHGAFLQRYENGSIELSGNYNEGNIEGELLGYYEDGTIRCKLQLIAGELDGDFLVNFSSRETAFSGKFEKGKLVQLQLNELAKKTNEQTTWADGNGQLAISPDGEHIESLLSFKDSMLTGTQLSYFENGVVWHQTNYLEGIAYGLHTVRDIDGKVVETGSARQGYKEGEWLSVVRNDTLNQKYELDDEIEFTGNFEHSALACFYPQSQVLKSAAQAPIIEYSQVIPEYYTGQQGIAWYLQKLVTYPEMEKQNDIQGVAYVQFVVNEYGEISRVKIVEGLEGKATKNMREEALWVISNFPRWKPGFLEGIPVKVSYSIPIRFKLR